MKSPQDRCSFAVGGIWVAGGGTANAPRWVKCVVAGQYGARRCIYLGNDVVYQIDTVPTRYNGYTTLAFFPHGILCGSWCCGATVTHARVPFCSVTFASISGLMLVVRGGHRTTRAAPLNHSQFQATGQPSRTGLRYATGLARIVLLCCRLAAGYVR